MKMQRILTDTSHCAGSRQGSMQFPVPYNHSINPVKRILLAIFYRSGD